MVRWAWVCPQSAKDRGKPPYNILLDYSVVKLQKSSYQFPMHDALERMKARGIWLGDHVIAFALEQAGEAQRE
jgi:hypothetical protein